MEHFEQKRVTTARVFDYAYYTNPTLGSESRALLFLHGFPDHAQLWDEVIGAIEAFQKQKSPGSAPLKKIVPDMLGYGGTAKPAGAAQYIWKGQADDLLEILNAEKVDKVIVVGHDWGSFTTRLPAPSGSRRRRRTAQRRLRPAGPRARRAPFQPARRQRRYRGRLWLPLPRLLGVPGRARRAALLHANLERFYEVMHGDEPDWVRTILCVPGAARKYIQGDHPRSGKVKPKPFAQKQVWGDRFLSRFAAPDSLVGPTRCYVAMATDVNRPSERTIPPERLTVQRPVLYIGSTGDAVCRPDAITGPRDAGQLPDLETHILEGVAHWIPMEAPQKAAEYIWSFIDRRFLQNAESK